MEALVQVPTLGGILLVDERKPEMSYRLLEQRSRHRKAVLCITREPPEWVARRHPMPSAEHYWLITGDGDRSVDPFRLDRMQELVDRFLVENPQGSVLIDGVELLMVMNSYEQVRDFLAALQSKMQDHHTDCLVPIDTRTLTVNELRELRDVFPMVRGDARS